jgi:predicted GNAT family N-acyltransferase
MSEKNGLASEFAEATHGTVLYKAAVNLRSRVLRAPLGLAFTEEQLQAEISDSHLVCLDGQHLVACVVLTPVDTETVKIRQMAVDPSRQGRRFGQRLLAYAEQVACAKGFEQAVLHARESALGFYEKSGYAVVGDPFNDGTLPHRKMVKRLTA